MRDGILTKIMFKLSWSSHVGAVSNCLILYLNSTCVPNWHVSPQDHILRERQPNTLDQQHGTGVGETQPLTLSLAASRKWRSPTPQSHPSPRMNFTVRVLSTLLKLIFPQTDYIHSCQTAHVPCLFWLPSGTLVAHRYNYFCMCGDFELTPLKQCEDTDH